QDDFPVAHCARRSAKYAVMHPSMTAAARDLPRLGGAQRDVPPDPRRHLIHLEYGVEDAESTSHFHPKPPLALSLVTVLPGVSTTSSRRASVAAPSKPKARLPVM